MPLPRKTKSKAPKAPVNPHEWSSKSQLKPFPWEIAEEDEMEEFHMPPPKKHSKQPSPISKPTEGTSGDERGPTLMDHDRVFCFSSSEYSMTPQSSSDYAREEVFSSSQINCHGAESDLWEPRYGSMSYCILL